MKKFAAILLTLALVLGVCGAANAQMEVRMAAFSSSATTDSFWYDFADKVNEQFPEYDFSIDLATSNGAEDYIKALVASGDFPDTMWVFQPALLIDGGVIQPIPDELEELLLQPEAYLVNGELYTMPLVQGALGIWYNKDIFREAGIETLPETWEEYMVACEKIKAIGIEPLGMAASEGWYIAGAFSMIWSPMIYGEDLHWPARRTQGEVLFNNPVSLRCLELLNESRQYWQEGYMSASYDEVKSLFFGGQVAMLAAGGQFNAGEVDSGEISPDFEIGYLIPPQEKKEDRRVNAFSDNLFVVSAEAKDEKLEAVTKILKFFFTTDCYVDYMTANAAMPTVKSFEEHGMQVTNEIAKIMIAELQEAIAEVGTVPHAHAAQGDDAWPAGCREMSEKMVQELAAGNEDYSALLDLMDKQWDLGVEQAQQQ